MASRCIKMDYEQAHCLIEVTREPEAATPTHVAHVYFVDPVDNGDVVRPMVDLYGHRLRVEEESATAAAHSAARYLEILFGRQQSPGENCELMGATVGPPVVISDLTPDVVVH
jgi:hypothetical protein